MAPKGSSARAPPSCSSSRARAAFEVASRGYVFSRGEVIAEYGVESLRADPRVQEADLGP